MGIAFRFSSQKPFVLMNLWKFLKAKQPKAEHTISNLKTWGKLLSKLKISGSR